MDSVLLFAPSNELSDFGLFRVNLAPIESYQPLSTIGVQLAGCQLSIRYRFNHLTRRIGSFALKMLLALFLVDLHEKALLFEYDRFVRLRKHLRERKERQTV